MRLSSALLLLPILGGCATIPSTQQPQSPPTSGQQAPQQQTPSPVPPTVPPPPASAGFRAPQVTNAPGLEYVIRQDADTLIRYFGAPRLDVREGDMRKLQFAGEPCVLDIFLYPLQPNAAPVATHLEARRASDGRAVDRAACANALRR